MAQVAWNRNQRETYRRLHLTFATLIVGANNGTITLNTQNAQYNGRELGLGNNHGRTFLKKDAPNPAGHQAPAAYANGNRPSMRVVVELGANGKVLETWLGIWDHADDVIVIKDTDDPDYFEEIWEKRRALGEQLPSRNHPAYTAQQAARTRVTSGSSSASSTQKSMFSKGLLDLFK